MLATGRASTCWKFRFDKPSHKMSSGLCSKLKPITGLRTKVPTLEDRHEHLADTYLSMISAWTWESTARQRGKYGLSTD